jgi:hypothetical protein
VKVLLVTNLYPPNAIGGYERLCASVASGLAARGHTLAVLTSDYGGLVADADDVAVERSLKLLVSPSSIYEPFIGSPAERAAINRHNLARLTEAMARVQPEVVLAGNLFFLDPRFEAALGKLDRPIVYLLTDVWLMNFVNEKGLQVFMRSNVLGASAGAAPLVPADPAQLFIETLDSQTAWEARESRQVLEEMRRHLLERALFHGRSAFQADGECCLCGRTSFLVRSPGPATQVLQARPATEAICARCGLDAEVRAVLHALALFAPAPDEAKLLFCTARPGLRMLLERKFPRALVRGPAQLLEGAANPSGISRALLVDQHDCAPPGSTPLDAAAPSGDSLALLRALSQTLAPDGALLFGAAPGRALEAWLLAAQLQSPSLAPPRAHAFWSDAHGYYGRERAIFTLRSTAQGSS